MKRFPLPLLLIIALMACNERAQSQQSLEQPGEAQRVVIENGADPAGDIMNSRQTAITQEISEIVGGAAAV